MTHSAPFLAGSFDGQKVRFDGELPTLLTADGELYRLVGRGRYASYRLQNGRGWGERRRFDHVARVGFLRAVFAGSSVTEAAKGVGFSPSPVYTALAKDSSFRLAYDQAQRAKRSKRPEDGSTLLLVEVYAEELAFLEEHAELAELADARMVVRGIIRSFVQGGIRSSSKTPIASEDEIADTDNIAVVSAKRQ